MQKLLMGLALALTVGAAVFAGGILAARPSADTTAIEARLAALEARLDERDERGDAVAPRRTGQPSLVGLAPRVRAGAPKAEGPAARIEATDGADAARAPTLTDVEGIPSPEQIQTLVDAAVEKKATQFRRMQDKKPSIDVFAETLALERGQREVVEEEVLRGQLEIQSILETLADDGTNFMDEVVEVMADGIAHPGENPGQWQKLFGRLMAEEFPGTDETYATRIEAVKKGVGQAFRRTLSDEQIATFEAWQMDPTEIQEIPSSPWKDVEARVIERARAMGAELPAPGD